MKKIDIFTKKWFSDWQTIDPWTDEKPFLPPWGRADVLLEYIAYAYYAVWGSGSVRFTVVSPSAPPAWDASAVGRTFAVEIGADWADEGFFVGAGLYAYIGATQNSYALYQAELLSVSGSTATIRLLNIVSATIPSSPFVTEVQYAYFVQILPPGGAATVVRDGEENAFVSALNPNPLYDPHPNRAADAHAVLPQTAQVLAPQGALASPPPVPIRTAAFQVHQFWAVQTNANLNATAPQPLYPNRLHLLFSPREGYLISFPLRTTQINLRTDGGPTGGSVALSGTNGAWVINTTPPTGAVATHTYLALHNDTAAHTGGSAFSTDLLQTTTSMGYVFSFVAPNPRVVAVMVVDFGGGVYGVRVSNAVSLLQPPTPGFTVLILLNATPGFPYFATTDSSPNLLPWDVITLLANHTQQEPIYTRLRWWAVQREYIAGQLYREILLDEREYPDSAQRLYHFRSPSPPVGRFLHNTAAGWLFPSTLPVKQATLRLHNRRHTQNPDTLLGMVETRAAVLAETADGQTLYAEDIRTLTYNDFTTQGGWTTGANWVEWVYDPFAEFPDGLLWRWRAAIFRDEASVFPVAQADSENPHPDITILTNPGAYDPITGAFVGGGHSIVIRFTTTNLPPGRYVLLVRAAAKRSASDTTPPVADLCEYYTLTIPEPLPSPPAGESACPPCVPLLAGESFPLLFPEPPTRGGEPIPSTPAGEWYAANAEAGCYDAWHCGFVQVSVVPPEWVDITLHFDNRVYGRAVQGTCKLRMQGALRRLDDEYTSERYITKGYDEEDIWRGYRARYELTLFISAPCMLWQAELIKFARRVDVLTRSGLIRQVEGLIAEDFAVQDLYSAAIVIVKLREQTYRKEYRY